MIDDHKEIDAFPQNFYQDHQGYIWFGGVNGLQKYDGYRIKSYPVEEIFEDHETVNIVETFQGFLTDSNKNLWITYESALLFYDSLYDQITRIDFEISESVKLSNYFHLNQILEDRNQNLWIGTNGNFIIRIPRDSLLKKVYESYPETSRTRYTLDLNNIISFAHTSIPTSNQNEMEGILMDTSQCIWISTLFYVVSYDTKQTDPEKAISFYLSHGKSRDTESLPRVHKRLFKDKYDNVWIACRNKIFHVSYLPQNEINPDLKKVEIVGDSFNLYSPVRPYKNHRKVTPYALDDMMVNIHCYDENLWIAGREALTHYTYTVDESGQYSFNRHEYFKAKRNDPKGLPSQPLNIFRSKDNVLWTYIWADGPYILNLDMHRQFHHFYSIPGNKNTLPLNAVASMHIDHLNNYWLFFANPNPHFARTNEQFNSFTTYHHEGIIHYMSNLYPDRYGNLWYTIFKNDTFPHLEVINLHKVYSLDDGHIHNYRFAKEHFKNHPPEKSLQVSGVIVDDSTDLWILENSGIYHLDLTGNSKTLPENFKRIEFEPVILFDSMDIVFKPFIYVPSFYNGTRDIIAINGEKLLFVNKKTRRSKIIDLKTLGINASFYGSTGIIDSKNNIWLSNIRNIFQIGIKYNDKGDPYIDLFRKYTKKDGFPRYPIQILLDKNEKIWFNTDRHGIFSYDPENEIIRSFQGTNVISGTVFGGLHYKDRFGNLYFNALDGITVFNPDDINPSSDPPQVIITDLFVNHKSLTELQDAEIIDNLRKSNILKVPFRDHTISIEFSAMQFSDPQNIKYKYILQGIDHDTVFISGSIPPVASYTNLSAGKHVFSVYASKIQGIWTENPSSLTIHIGPPWWLSPFAITAYALFLITALLTWRYFLIRNLQLKHTIKLKETEANKLAELDHAKSTFFANVSHEFRTPLTLILGPLEKILHGGNNIDLRKEAVLMYKYAKKLKSLIDQILNLSKFESEIMKLNIQEADLAAHVRLLLSGFESMANYHGIRLQCDLPKKCIFYYDPILIESLVENLLSNSIKNSDRDDEIIISLKTQKKKTNTYVSLRITDTGIGIPKDEIPYIFNRFYQVKGSNNTNGGTGIGLYMVKEIVDLHQGRIKVKSKIGKGSSFTIIFPVGIDHSERADLFNQSIISPHRDSFEIEDDSKDSIDEKNLSDGQLAGINDKQVILVVEDNRDMREFIKSILVESYTVNDAANGKDGYNLALSTIPDLIICDLMMPVMDGMEFCNKIKKEQSTSHIPIIMLTAKVDKNSHLQSMKLGADDYITKPFDKDILCSRVENLLHEREFLRKAFVDHWLKQQEMDHEIRTIDLDFIKVINSILDQEYANIDYSITRLARDIGMSHSALYRKVKSITNLSPNQYIQQFRLMKAKNLLASGSHQISEVALLSGFNNLSYFSKSFKKSFGAPPQKYIQKNRTGHSEK